MELNEMQKVASTKFQYWYNHPESRTRPWFEISGAAGTGKTTVVKHIIASLGIKDEDIIFMAFVGKAALALRLSGVNGRTIHSVLYDSSTKILRDENGEVVYDDNGKPKLETIFTKVNKLPDHIKLLVVDEGGMVDSKMGRDILSFGIPTLVLGDLNQLPPVFGTSLFLNTPDVILNEIMRQSKDSAIIYLSQLATHGIGIPLGSYNNGECRVIRKNQLTDTDVREADLIICSTNRMRDVINNYTRKYIYGIDAQVVVPGDKIICRKNCWGTILPDDSFGINIALVNGMIGNVTKVNRNTPSATIDMMIDFKPEFSNTSFKDVPINSSKMFEPYHIRKIGNTRYIDYVVFEFGYCSTCHLAQGSQYDNIIVYVDGAMSTTDYFCRWLYTAITRAKKKLTLVY